MQVLLSVLLFVLSSLSLSGNEWSNTLLASVSIEEEEQLSVETSGAQLHSLLLEDFSSDLAFVEVEEQEEKNENKSSSDSLCVHTSNLLPNCKGFIDWQTTFYSTKPKLEGLHKYDLFGCWKTHLA
jgi:hypothetical protein